ncbi:hypothetical protein EV401DRAFT_1860000 [Pisolithus croceorrhizus]|nr:hypothetical protein EV401DRAFT_1860000 [Pisolithus croceorrhizus]
MHIVQISYDVFNIRPPCICYHTSILSGCAWILELMNGHPDHIKTNLGVMLNVFLALINILIWNGIMQSQNGVGVEEWLGIFLYMCVTP